MMKDRRFAFGMPVALYNTLLSPPRCKEIEIFFVWGRGETKRRIFLMYQYTKEGLERFLFSAHMYVLPYICAAIILHFY